MLRRHHVTFALLALVGCGPIQGTSSTPTQIGVAVTVTQSYAAMEEIPVAGGELRLVEPRPMSLDDGSRMETIAFPLRHTAVDARVVGMSALYTVEQTFENPYDEPIDAVYVFPLGDESAVTRYQIVIGDRTIEGEIAKRDDARRTYEAAKAEGHTAALLEQEKRNVFSQRIANLAPRAQIKVRFELSELLTYVEGQYELAFPLVVGPRYLPADRAAHGRSPVGSRLAGQPGGAGTSIPYTKSTLADSTVSFTADIDAGVPVHGVTSPSHQLAVRDAGPTKRIVTLARAGELPNRDLVVRYKVASEQTMIGVMAHRTDKRGYFTLTVQPKAAYRIGEVAPREVMIVIDTSGSMEGEPIAQARALATKLVDSLQPHDTFDVIGFAGSIDVMSPTAIAGDANGKARGKQFIAQLAAGGGTEMGPAIAQALARDPGADRIRMIYFLTDGFVGNDDVIVSAARSHLGSNRLFPVGVGTAPNRSLLNQLAAVGRGFPSYLNLGESAQALGDTLVRRSAYPYMTNIAIDWKGLAVTDLVPKTIPDVYAGAPLVVSGTYSRAGRATIEVSATTAGRRVTIPIEVALPDRHDAEPVAALWARRSIDELLALAGDHVDDATIARVTELGLAHHMVTEWTSFVAVDRTRVVAPGGKARLVEQPALAPHGVNLDTAVGAEPAPSSAGSYSSGDYGGGGWGAGGDSDPLTLLVSLALFPLGYGLRRMRQRSERRVVTGTIETAR